MTLYDVFLYTPSIMLGGVMCAAVVWCICVTILDCFDTQGLASALILVGVIIFFIWFGWTITILFPVQT